MESKEKTVVKKQSLVIDEWKTLRLSGISDIIGVDEGSVTLRTEEGKIFIEGRSLKIESLEKDSGVVLIKGEITGVFKSEPEGQKRGFLRGIFGG